MPKKLNHYADKDKARRYRNAQRKRNYDATSKFSAHRSERWSREDTALVLAHSISDRMLAQKIGRSARAIQIKRSRIKPNRAQRIPPTETSPQ